jgi:hypothetical protein
MDDFIEHARATAVQAPAAADDEDDDAQPESLQPPTPGGGHEVFDRLTFANQFDAGTLTVHLDRALDAFDAEHDRERQRDARRAARAAERAAAARTPPRPPSPIETVEDLAQIAPAATRPARALGDQSFDVRFPVQLVPQQTGRSCWAAGAAMVVGWRDRVSINPDEIARAAGYWRQYAEGLEAEDTNLLERVWGLQTEPGQSYSLDGFRRLLDTYGPLWTAGAVPGAHIRVVAGMYGDGSPNGTMVVLYDPWEKGMATFSPANRGSVYEESYADYQVKQDELARRESDVQGVYVAHAREPLAADDPRRQR